jgi:hypothetical protein
MRKIILIVGAAAALALAGCNQGGTSDQYGTTTGNSTTNGVHHGTNAPVTP